MTLIGFVGLSCSAMHLALTKISSRSDSARLCIAKRSSKDMTRSVRDHIARLSDDKGRVST